jgi:hypothetical protein
MKRKRGVAWIALGTWACSSSGGGPAEQVAPASWTPGRYALEAEVGNSLTDETFTAQLTIGPDGTMTMNSSSGLCQTPTPSQVQRDQERGQATFECGDATWRLRAAPGTVRGDIRASILEEYRAPTPCPSGTGTCYIMRTQRVTRTADLGVTLIR